LAAVIFGDSLYEAVLYVRGKIHSLGADAQEEPLQAADIAALGELLKQAGFDANPRDFKRIGSDRRGGCITGTRSIRGSIKSRNGISIWTWS
jgi:hypothetical protein